MITFDEIALDLLEPGVFVEIKPNYRSTGVLPWPVRSLIIGQKLATGTLAAGSIVEIVRPEQAIALFGAGSVGAEQVMAFRKVNKGQPLYVTALSDSGGAVKATGTFTFGGAVSASAVIRFKIGDRQVRITATPADTVTTLATKLVAAITADSNMVVTAASAAGVVTLTARNGGEVGNDIDMRVDVSAGPLPSGLTVAVVAMANGAGNPVLQTALDLLANAWFTHVTHPWSDATNMTAFATWLTSRYVATARMDAHGFVGKRGTYGQLSTFGALTNCPFLTCLGLNRPPTNSWVIAAAAMGLAAFHLANDPARQLRSLVLTGITAPDAPDQFTTTEQDLLLRTGISTLDCLADGSVVVSRMITTYRTSSLGIADRAWLDIMVPATLSRIRYDWSGYVALMYPRSKLADDDTAAAFASRSDEDDNPGNAVVTPKRMKGSWAARCRLYADKAWIEDIERTIKESVFERNADDRNRLDTRQQVRIVGNLMVLAASLEFQV